MPNNLVTEIRIDKNGVPVTRHVKPQAAATSKALPQPTLQPAPSQSPYPERGEHTLLLLGQCLQFLADESLSADDFSAVLKGYSDDTIRLLNKHVGDSHTQTYFAELAAVIGRKLPEKVVREYAMFSPTVADCEDLNETISYVSGLRHYAPLRDIDDLTLADEETKAVSRSLLRIAFHLHCMNDYGEDHPAAIYAPDPTGQDRDCPVIKSPSLVSLIAANPSRSSDIAEHIEEHGFKTVKAVREMLEGTHHATREGWL